MSSVFFELETMNPNFRETYFKIKNYANYIANSEYVIRNENTSHGLFGIVEGFEKLDIIPQQIDKILLVTKDRPENVPEKLMKLNLFPKKDQKILLKKSIVLKY